VRWDDMSPKVAFATLGCKVNQYDSEAMEGLFREAGYEVVDFSSPADVYVVNTCTVTHRSDAKARQLLRRAARTNPAALRVVAGCYAQVSPAELAAMGVDLVVGLDRRGEIVRLVEQVRRSRDPLVAVGDVWRMEEFEELPVTGRSRTRATIKVQEGCDEFCAYCIVPYARGRIRSRDPERVVEEVRRLEAAGFHEVVITGVHLGAYGRDRGDLSLEDLVRRIHASTGIERIRLSSVEPMDITPGLVDCVTTLERVCPHMHIPLQSGCDETLARMRRRYTTEDFRRLVAALREGRPDIAISTDLMVGFPGETEEEFERSLAFVEEMAFSRLHVFRYSRRKGTPAARLPDQVPAEVKAERSRRALALGERLALDFHRRFLGQSLEVLVEEEREGEFLQGLTGNYIRVFLRGSDELMNRLVPVTLTRATPEGAWGKIGEG